MFRKISLTVILVKVDRYRECDDTLRPLCTVRHAGPGPGWRGRLPNVVHTDEGNRYVK